jgi:hypothetical protein
MRFSSTDISAVGAYIFALNIAFIRLTVSLILFLSVAIIDGVPTEFIALANQLMPAFIELSKYNILPSKSTHAIADLLPGSIPTII